MKTRGGARRGTCVVLGTLLAVAAGTLAVFWTRLLDVFIAQNMRLSPEARGYSQWVEPTLPIYFDVYLFNWTNPEELAAGAAPHVTQLGPYRYRERRTKVELAWFGNHSVSYRTRRTWLFQPHLSNGSLHDNVTTLDVIAAATAYRARHSSVMLQTLASIALRATGHNQVWVRRTAAELLFDGYEDNLLKYTSWMSDLVSSKVPSLERFGWFYQRNGSLEVDGHVTVSDGSEGGAPAGQILRWNHAETAAHLAPQCNQVRGSLGEFFPRLGARPRADHVTLFSPDLCRPLRLRAAGAGAVRGLRAWRYAVDARALDNATACWCGGECVLSGALNVSACRFGSPAFVSLPHFLHADPQYRRDVRGLAPLPHNHSFYIDIEPTTGVPLDVAARFQLNILLAPYKAITLLERVPRVMFPVLWVEQRVQVPRDAAAQLAAAQSAAAWGGPLLCGAAALSLAVAALACCLPRPRRPPAPAASPPPHLNELTTLV